MLTRICLPLPRRGGATLNDTGITRIVITDPVHGRGAWRFAESLPLQPIANRLYRETFAGAGLTLLPGEQETRSTGDEFNAGYDKQLGIDVFLRFASGMRATLQEKFLTTGDRFTTVTVEYYQDWRTQEPGDWFALRCDYYFVGYHQRGIHRFDKWILLDWPAIQRATAQGHIPWQERNNMNDNARASFRFVAFDDIPDRCVFARQPGSAQRQALDTLRTIAGPNTDQADPRLPKLPHPWQYLHTGSAAFVRAYIPDRHVRTRLYRTHEIGKLLNEITLYRDHDDE